MWVSELGSPPSNNLWWPSIVRGFQRWMGGSGQIEAGVASHLDLLKLPMLTGVLKGAAEDSVTSGSMDRGSSEP